MGRPLKASVVVPNWNGRAYLDACLGSVLEGTVEGGFEVILVDNASSDGSVEHVRRRWPGVRVVEAATNLGFAGGCNLGIRESRADHVALLNNDTRARPGWLAALVAAMESSHPPAGAVTSKLVAMDRPGLIQNAGGLLLSDGSGGQRGAGHPDDGAFDQPEEVFAMCGGAALLRRAALDDVGLLDEDFFAYYEDTDLSWRMRLRGWTVLYEPAAVVEHVHSGTSVEWSPFFTFHVDRNRLLMLLKNAPAGMVARTFWGFGARAARGAARPGRPRPGGAEAPPSRARSGARTHLRVVASLLRLLPRMLRRRWRIRRTRTVPDAEIARWLYPRELWDAR